VKEREKAKIRKMENYSARRLFINFSLECQFDFAGRAANNKKKLPRARICAQILFGFFLTFLTFGS
jgi:hypothetical protein